MDNNQHTRLHRMGVPGIYTNTGKSRIFLSFNFVLSLFCTGIVSYLANDHHYTGELLAALAKAIVGYFPDMLGFTLSAYAIVIGLGNVRILRKLSRANHAAAVTAHQKPTLYQKLNGLFASCLLLLFLSFIAANVIEFINGYIETHPKVAILLPGAALFTLLLTTLWSMLLLMTIMMTLFNIGQLQNWHYQANETDPEN